MQRVIARIGKEGWSFGRGWTDGLGRFVAAWRAYRRRRVDWNHVSDGMLRDIGVERADVDPCAPPDPGGIRQRAGPWL